MKSFKNIFLGLFVVVFMVLAFGAGLLTNSNLVAVLASPAEDDVDMPRVLDVILGRDKQLETAVITSPHHWTTLRFLYGSDVVIMPIQADVTPVEAGSEVMFGLDGTTEIGGPGWNGSVTSGFATVGPPAAASINIYSLGENMAGAHRLYALKQSADAASAFTYEVLPGNEDIVTIEVIGVEAAVSDVNMDGILDNPFAEMMRGDIYVATLIGGDGVTRKSVAIADLDPDVAKQANPLGIVVSLQSQGVEVRLLTPTLSMLQTGGVVPLDEKAEAFLIAEIAPDLATLTSTALAASVPPLPGAVAFGGQFVEVAIVYSVDNGVTFTEVPSVPENLAVAMAIYGLDIDPMPARGAAIWSIGTDVDFTAGFRIPAEENWLKRTGSVLDAASQSMGIYLTYLSAFVPIESQLEITEVIPIIGPAAGGNPVTLFGSFLTQAGTALRIYFGNPLSAGTLATLYSYVSPTAMGVLPPSMEGITADTTVDVVLANSRAPSDFVVLPKAYTFAEAPQITDLSPISGPGSGGTVVTITGSALSRTSSVYIAGVASLQYSVLSDTMVTAITRAAPEGRMGTVDIRTPGGIARSTQAFTINPQSGIDSFSPASGTELGGTVVTIDGFGLDIAQTVTIAGVRTPIFTVNSSTQILATTLPAPSITSGVVEVVTTGGTFRSTEVYSYEGEPPVIRSFDVTSGSIVGGDIVIISGQALNKTPVTTIAGVEASFELGTSSRLVVSTGATATAVTGKIVVTTTRGRATSVADFEYFSPAATQEPLMCFAGESIVGGPSWAGALSGDVLLLVFVSGALALRRRRLS